MGEVKLQIAIYTTFGTLLIALAMCIWRMVVGPRLADRIVAVDMLALLGLGFIGAYAILTEEYAYLDVAIGLALVGFLATVAFARYVYFRDFIKQEGAADDD